MMAKATLTQTRRRDMPRKLAQSGQDLGLSGPHRSRFTRIMNRAARWQYESFLGCQWHTEVPHGHLAVRIEEPPLMVTANAP